MWQLFLNRLALDQGWFWGLGGLLLVVLGLIFFSFFRNIRNLAWFSFASLFAAALYTSSIAFYSPLLDFLVSYRSDWSLLYLTQNPSLVSLLTLLVFYFLVYSILAIALTVLLDFWCLVTFRWQRLRTILQRSISQSWFVGFFSVVSVVTPFLWQLLAGSLQQEIFVVLFQFFSFLFLLQLVLRLVDSAYVSSPRQLMEFVFFSSLLFYVGGFIYDGVLFLTNDQVFAQAFFLRQFFLFFLLMLLMGFLGHFLVKAWFASALFLDHYHRQTSLLFSWTSRFFFSSRDGVYTYRMVFGGIVLTLFLGVLFLFLASQGFLLILIPAFFLSYFLLFVLLDQQEDLRVRGDLVDKRIESAVNRVFFG